MSGVSEESYKKDYRYALALRIGFALQPFMSPAFAGLALFRYAQPTARAVGY